MRILKNDTADFSIEIKNLDNLYIAKVTESHIRLSMMESVIFCQKTIRMTSL